MTPDFRNIDLNSRKIFWAKAIVHLIVLFMIFIGPELVFSIGRNIPKVMFLMPLTYIILFYINYYWITNQFIFKKRRIGTYALINIILTLIIVVIFYIVETTPRPPIELNATIPPMPKPDGILPPNMIPGPGPKPEPGPITGAPYFIHVVRALTMIPRIGTMALLSVSLSFLLKAGERWIIMERQNQQMKSELQEKELKNLKNQLNPHFLFNTLNNIYALIPICQEKAQESVHELSQLLRYSLYSNENREVPLEKELLFIKNYISLMKLRLNSLVSLDANIDENIGNGKFIAPMLLITLIENAFKHGVSGSSQSYISIKISVTDDCLNCIVSNSYHPKNESDKSGSGIGIANLKRQLDILYPNRHNFEIKQEDDIYTSHLTIIFTKN